MEVDSETLTAKWDWPEHDGSFARAAEHPVRWSPELVVSNRDADLQDAASADALRIQGDWNGLKTNYRQGRPRIDRDQAAHDASAVTLLTSTTFSAERPKK
jgi:hypothetical protein